MLDESSVWQSHAEMDQKGPLGMEKGMLGGRLDSCQDKYELVA